MRLKDIRCAVLDLDGTIYFGNELAPDAKEFLAFCRQNFKTIFFATNNAAKTRLQIYQKLKDMGIELREDEVLNSGFLTAQYLLENKLKDIYCFGTANLAGDLAKHGINITEDKPQAVVTAYHADFDLKKLEKALNIILKNNCKIIASNVDRAYPREGGVISPGAGSILKALEYALNRQADAVVGKPSVHMLAYIAQKLNLKPHEILVVGDNVETDIKMALDFGSPCVWISPEKKEGVICARNLKEAMEALKNED